MARQPLTVFQLGSGSCGNATVVAGPRGALLIDAGFSAKETLRRAASVGVAADSIRGIVVSHGHGDHAGGVPVLARRLQVPVWATEPTLERLTNLRGSEDLRVLPRNGRLNVAGMAVDTMPVPHDAPGTIIARVEGRVAVATDLGIADTGVRDFLDGLDGLLLEFNHDLDMLAEGEYPHGLKDRVRSDTGHLSNAQAADLLTSPQFRLPKIALWLCHLSRNNNTPTHALCAAEDAVDGRDLNVVMTSQFVPARPVTLA
ncbi:MAG: MBL fold metallo-hydrolase [Myxococcota bacterium]